MPIRILLVDDEDTTDLPDQIRHLGIGDFEVDALLPPPNLDLDGVLSQAADLFLIDYELDTTQSNGDLAPYRGMTLAARLRELRPDYPIALLTRSSLPSWTAVEKTARAAAPIDDVFYKEEDLRDKPECLRARLLSLATGYRILRQDNRRSQNTLLGLLQTDEHGKDLSLKAQPPQEGWNEFEAAHWIRDTLLRFPGVLYCDAYAATALGISVESFRQRAIATLFENARYRGPFHEDSTRWWRHQLFDISATLTQTAGPESDSREEFHTFVTNELDLCVDRSVDNESGLSPADTVCYLLGIPVRIETSFPYDPDSRPAVMDRARVSFKAVRELNDVEISYIDPASRDCVSDVIGDL